MTLDETFKAAKAGDLTNDTTYKVGEISRKTGLQKQPDGSWAPPKGQAKKPLTRQDNTILAGQAGRTLNNNVQAAGPKRDVSAENRAYHEKVEKERADRNARADNKASAARQEAEERHLSGVEMKDFFLAKTYEGTSVAMAQRGLEAQGFDLLEANENINVYERPEGGRITMQLEGNKIKSADYKTPAETAAEGRAGNEPKPLPAASEEKKSLKNVPGYSVYRDGESRNGYYREYRNGNDIIRYDQNGYDDRAEGKKYSAMESGPGGKRRFFNSLQEAADWIKKGSPRNDAPAASREEPKRSAEERQAWASMNGFKNEKEMQAAEQEALEFERKYRAGEIDAEGNPIKKATSSQDAAYTAESVNAPRENLERKLTGDCKIRIRK